MKTCIRKGVFETNSSSSHSLVVAKDPRPYTKEELALGLYEGYPKETFSLFDFCDDPTYERYPLRILSTPIEKMQYYVAAKLGAEDNMEEKPAILSMISEATGIPKNKIKLTTNDRFNKYGFASTYNDTGEHPFEYMKRKGITPKEMIFDPRYVLIVDGDELMTFKKLFTRHIILCDDIEDISSGREFWEDSEFSCNMDWFSPEMKARFKNFNLRQYMSEHFHPWHKVLYIDVSPTTIAYCDNEIFSEAIKAAKKINPDAKVILRRDPYASSKKKIKIGNLDTSLFDEVLLDAKKGKKEQP